MSDFITKEILFGFIGGSGFGVILKLLVDLYNRNADHKRDLAKILYERRLDAAEKGIAFYWNSYIETSNIKASLEVLKEVFKDIEEGEISTEIISVFMDNSAKSIKIIEKASLIDRNGMHLFFDIKDENFWNEDDLIAYLETTGKIKFIDNKIDYFNKQQMEAYDRQEPQVGEHFYTKMLECFEPYSELTDELILVLEKNKTALLKVIEKVRKEIKD